MLIRLICNQWVIDNHNLSVNSIYCTLTAINVNLFTEKSQGLLRTFKYPEANVCPWTLLALHWITIRSVLLSRSTQSRQTFLIVRLLLSLLNTNLLGGLLATKKHDGQLKWQLIITLTYSYKLKQPRTDWIGLKRRINEKQVAVFKQLLP